MTKKLAKHRQPVEWWSYREVVDSTGLTALMIQTRGKRLGEAAAYTTIRSLIQTSMPDSVRREGTNWNSPVMVNLAASNQVRQLCYTAMRTELARLRAIIQEYEQYL